MSKDADGIANSEDTAHTAPEEMANSEDPDQTSGAV